MSYWKSVPVWVAAGMIGWIIGGCVVTNAAERDWVILGFLLFICFALFWAWVFLSR